ncbi:MAG: hypothetical protein AMXMBFR33_28130 [Candidatus Xenobia bacterium]
MCTAEHVAGFSLDPGTRFPTLAGNPFSGFDSPGALDHSELLAFQLLSARRSNSAKNRINPDGIGQFPNRSPGPPAVLHG